MNVVFLLVALTPVLAQESLIFDCSSLLPQGRTETEKETTEIPFKFVVSRPRDPLSQYETGGKITVTISSEAGFVGFIVQARKVDGDVPVGVWEGAKQATCQRVGDSVTHESDREHNGVELTWTAPSTNTGPVHFVTTVVDKAGKFWHKISSQNFEEWSEEPEETPVAPEEEVRETPVTAEEEEEETPGRTEEEATSQNEGAEEEEESEGANERMLQEEAEAEERSRIEEERRLSEEERSQHTQIQWEMMEAERHQWQEMEARKARMQEEEEATRLWLAKQKEKAILKINPKDVLEKDGERVVAGVGVATVSMATFLTLLAAIIVL